MGNEGGQHQKCHPPTSNDGAGGHDREAKVVFENKTASSSENDGSSTNERAPSAPPEKRPGSSGMRTSEDPGPTRVSVQLGRPSTGSAAGHRSGPDY
ncbi:hypothetical protein IscW_ISCW015830 [Ixodes scapularis]|uniref:Uncharacterized protein n=1 Tax=Ixodes scapularis TaxID=6945 RepID=B7P490_IXOSC|nr:hypothetical protein IscW_ISCW015830 [Ixodes scapularis]|eukprot:XP_002405639.1 hypothetical protein IscW_ISCW015830 [Ixodes scapularis]